MLNRPFSLLFLSLMYANVNAQTFTYTQSETGSNRIPLGYEVPIAVNSITPVDGFRSYESLHMRHEQLNAMSDFVNQHNIGATTANLDIWAYSLSDDNNLTLSGAAEGSALINGGIHAREWQTPEALTGYMEYLVEHESDQYLGQYLLENLNLVLIPVLNVEGFQQTQRFPDMVTTSIGTPRDGRMRRKNMRGVDQNLATSNDNLGGIDLNRNSPPFWATDPQGSSNNNTSLVYHGSAESSEPETQALQQGAELAGRDSLRFYIDTHSFTQVYLTPQTNNSRRNGITQRLARAMRAANDFKYDYDPRPAGSGIGATDEYFAEEFQIPSYTLEIEPRNSAAVYGGLGVSHDGFILPASEVSRMRTETTKAAVAGLYGTAEVPMLMAVNIARVDNGEEVINQAWQVQNAGREIQTTQAQELQGNVAYRMTLTFNKPMRNIENGQVAAFSTLSQEQDIEVALVGLAGSENTDISLPQGQWLHEAGFSRYKTDSYQLDFTLADTFQWNNHSLLAVSVDTLDMIGQKLDSHPATIVSWREGSWQGYENTSGATNTDLGGIDKSMRLIDDGSPLFEEPAPPVTPPAPPAPNPPPTPPPENQGSSGGAVLWVWLILPLAWLRRKARAY